MYSLVKFYDGIYYVCLSKHITINKSGMTKSMYSDGRKYPASIIAKNNDKTLLKEVLRNISKDIPYPLCKQFDLYKNTLDIRKTIEADEDGNNCEIHIQNETEELACNNSEISFLDDKDKQITPTSQNSAFNIICNIQGDDDMPIFYEDEQDLSNNDNNISINTANVSADFTEGIDLEIVNTETTNMDISFCGHSDFESINLENLENCNKRLTFDTEESVDDAVDAHISNYEENANKPCNKENVPVFDDIDTDKEDNDNDSEYIPSEQSSLNEEFQPKNNSISDKTVSSISSFDISQLNMVTTSACNDETMYVEKSNTKSMKRNYCFFCMKPQLKLARHLETVHSNEPEVKKFGILPKNNPERKKIIETIRKNGNFKFNTCSNFNNGQLIVCRRPNEKYNRKPTDFIACVKCKGFFAKNTIRHHSRKCLQQNFKKNKTIMIMGRKITGRIHQLANEIVRRMLFPVLRDDDVTRVVRYDELLILYANKLCIKYKSQHQHDMIRARLRVLGRFLLALKKINKDVKDFKSLYHPKIYDDCISAINVVAGYDNDEKMYKAPAVASNLSTLIKYIGNLLITEYIKREDTEKKKLVKDFLKLLIVDIGTSVNKTVIESQSAQKRNKKVILPSLEDIKKLHKHLETKRIEAYNMLELSFSYDKWIKLAQITLTLVHLFNRRRAGEIERVLIDDFKNYDKVNKNMNSDIYNSLSEKNRKIAEKYVRFCIRGKLGRTVPVLLPSHLFKCINLILKFRKEANVPNKNPYVFGLPGATKGRYKYLRACILMRKFASECNATNSSTLRGTTLRKHIATYCIQLNITDDDVSDLATFMGHGEKIHREHYRQPLPARDILKISQYLEAVQGNTQDNEISSDSENDELEKNTIDNSDKIDISNVEVESCAIQKEQKANKKQKRSTSPYGRTKRQRWTEKEREDALQAFATHMENFTLPSLKEIQQVKRRYSSLTRRTSPQIKTWLHNKQKALRKNYIT